MLISEKAPTQDITAESVHYVYAFKKGKKP